MINNSSLLLLRKALQNVTGAWKIFLGTIFLILVVSSLTGATPKNSNESKQLLSLDELKKKKVYYSIENALQNPDKVYKLSLYHTALLAIPSCIKKFDNLQVLDVSRNRLSELPEEIGELENLQYLNVEDNQISELPQSIKNLKNLEVLNVRRNDISMLPEEIGQLQNLEVLTAEYNAIASLPEEISNLKNLKTLNLKNNQLDDLTKKIGSLTQLKELNIKYNEIASLPETIANLQNLDMFGINLHKLTIKEINKFGRLLAGTDTDLGRQYLQSHDVLNQGKFANMEMRVSKTDKFEDKELFCSVIEFNRLVNKSSSGKGMVIWKMKDNEPVVVYSILTDEAEPKKKITSEKFTSIK